MGAGSGKRDTPVCEVRGARRFAAAQKEYEALFKRQSFPGRAHLRARAGIQGPHDEKALITREDRQIISTGRCGDGQLGKALALGFSAPARLGSFVARLLRRYFKQWRRLEKLSNFCLSEGPCTQPKIAHADSGGL